jgi:DNA-directed RNA polymerase subunit RPC12/RpoP
MTNIHRCKNSSYDELDDFFENKIQKGKQRSEKFTEKREKKPRRVLIDTQDFKCRQCGVFVSASREQSGVNNRNHCPHCLWSRHVDETIPGDRKADCGSRMQPVGLTVKRTPKRYTRSDPGELMLVHRCTGCGKISINRIAADDDTPLLFQLFLLSSDHVSELLLSLREKNIRLLSEDDFPLVYTQLFGKSTFIQEWT